MTVDQQLPSIMHLMQHNKVPSILNKKSEEQQVDEQPNTSNFLNKVLNFSPIKETSDQKLPPVSSILKTKKPKPADTAKTYYCYYCHKNFTRPSTLKTHMYMHTGEKPFHCSYPGCKSKFNVLSNMKRHLRNH